jgi:hypothetical protein
LQPYQLPPPPVPSAAPAPLVTTAAAPVPVPEQPGRPPLGVPAGYAGPEQPSEDTQGSFIQLEPPGPDRLFRLESERTLFERIRQEGLQRTPREVAYFPQEPVLSRQTYPGRQWPVQGEVVEPHYLCYGRLLFEQRNLERYGWDLGAVTPVVSAGKFFADFVMSPYHAASDVCRCYDCNTGYCLPGDPVPLLLYPPEWSLTGAIAEGAAVGATLVLFP